MVSESNGSGERVLLVLGGGGVKGMAHIGAWQAIEEAGLEISGIVGTSIGSLVGAALAGGLGWRDLAPLALELRQREIISLNRRALLFNGIRQRSIFHGGHFLNYIRRILPVHDFGELGIPLSLNAVDLETGEMEWFGAGGRTDLSLDLAVYASCALPLFYPPAEIGGRYYLDGGVLDVLPIEFAAGLGASRIVAVDVSSGGDADLDETLSNGLISIHQRTFDIMARSRREVRLAEWSGPPMTYIRPALDGFQTFDFERTQYFLEEGYRATRQALQGWNGGGLAGERG